MSVPTKNPKNDLPRKSSTPLTLIAAFTGTALVAGVVGAAIAMPAVGGVGAVVNSAVENFKSLPTDLADPTLPELSVIRDSSGKRLAYFYEQNRTVVNLKQISPQMQKAIIAIEDSRFYEHNGVDLRGTARAFATNQQSGSVQQGGSTITQQYVKMVLLNNAKTKEEEAAATAKNAQRKLREASLAIALEKEKTKGEVLAGYLNIAYFGSGAYGVEAAAQTYFSKPASKLTTVEAATLAGIVQQPGTFDPIRNRKDSRQRRDVVLNRMYELGEISTGQLKRAKSQKIQSYVNQTKFPNGCTTSDSPYFCDYALNYIRGDSAFGSTRRERVKLLRRGGLDITTTLNPGDQRSAQNAVRGYIPIGDASNKAAAISMVQPGTGKVLAMAQNTRWGTEDKLGVTSFNYNVRYRDGGTIGMQAGSTFKVFTLAAALEKGISPYVGINAPSSATFYGFRDCDGYEFPPYTVGNYTGSPSGVHNMFTGTKSSVNTFFIGLERLVELCRQSEIAESMGVRTGSGKKLPAIPSFPLGSIEVVPLDMAGAYATFANDGVFCKANPIQRVTRSNGKGKDLYQYSPDCKRVLSSRVADTIVALTQGTMQSGGTGQGLTFGRPVAGKTGTTDNISAVWFTGYTPQISSSVWVGDPRGGYKYPLRNVWINGRYYSVVYGGKLPGPIWRSAMAGAHADLPYQGFGGEAKFITQKYNESQSRDTDSGSGNADRPNSAPSQTPTPQPAAPDSGNEEDSDFLDRLRNLDFGF
jgi:membrane peptidoglycan carboxypeptidase